MTPEGLRAFAEAAGVSRKPARTELATFEHAVRDDLNMRVPRVMCVTNPLKVVLTNYPEGQVEELDASYYPHDVPKTGSRKVPFSRELYIERDDFMEDPPKKFFRLAPGREVRLRYGYFITCTDVVKDAAGEIVELRCTYDPATRGGDSPDGRKVQGTIHWVSAAARARLRASAVRQAVHGSRIPTTSRTAGFHERAESRFARGGARREDRAERGERSGRDALSVRAHGVFRRAISVDSRPGRARRSTARSRCATRGRRSRGSEVVSGTCNNSYQLPPDDGRLTPQGGFGRAAGKRTPVPIVLSTL